MPVNVGTTKHQSSHIIWLTRQVWILWLFTATGGSIVSPRLQLGIDWGKCRDVLGIVRQTRNEQRCLGSAIAVLVDEGTRSHEWPSDMSATILGCLCRRVMLESAISTRRCSHRSPSTGQHLSSNQHKCAGNLSTTIHGLLTTTLSLTLQTLSRWYLLVKILIMVLCGKHLKDFNPLVWPSLIPVPVLHF